MATERTGSGTTAGLEGAGLAGIAADRAAVRTALAAITAAWRGGHFDDLGRLFHPQVVFAAPGLRTRAIGRDACVATYRRFQETVTLTDWEEGTALIDVMGSTAVATVPWAMRWAHGDHFHTASGQDILVFQRTGDAWLLTWRTTLPAGGADHGHDDGHDHDHDH